MAQYFLVAYIESAIFGIRILENIEYYLKMKKSNSQMAIDATNKSRAIFDRNSSYKSTNPPSEKQHTPQYLSRILPKTKAMPANDSLKVDSKTIVFYGKRQVNEPQFINIQNTGKDMMRVNLILPKTKYFQLHQEIKNFNLSSGISKKICIDINRKIQFSDQYYSDEIIIQTQNSKDKVKLQWFQRKPTLKYTQLMDLKTLDIGRQQRITLQFQNISKEFKIQKVRLVKDTWDNIQIGCDQFTLQPMGSKTVEVILYPQVFGAYHHKIVVQCQDKLLQPIEIIYSAIDFSFRIQNQKQEPIKQINFGSLLRGIKKEIVVYANNNSPHQVQLKSKIKIGTGLRAQSTLQSPQQLGVQCSSTVIEVLSKCIRIPPFSKKELSLTTESKVQDKHNLLVDRYAKMQSTNTLKPKLGQEESQHHQILVCQFIQLNKKNVEAQHYLSSGFTKNLIVTPMHAKFSLPTLRVTPNCLNLGSVLVGGTVQGLISIQNMNNQIAYGLSLNKLFSFDFFLSKKVVQPKNTANLQVFLKGINIGKYVNNIEFMIFDTYSIKIPIEYEVICAVNSQKSQERLYKTGFSSLYNSASQQSVDFNKTLLHASTHKNRSKYERINIRKGVAKTKSSQSLLQRDSKGTQVLQSFRNSTSKGKQNMKQKFIGDEQISCNISNKIFSASTEKKYNLFVTKKIDKYVPYEQSKDHKKLLKTRNNKDYFNNTIKRTPKNRKQAQQIQRELSPQQLKLITISEKIINFGRIFIKSKVEKEFIVVNNTEAAIVVQLHQNTNDPKKLSILSQSDFQQQIINQNGAARFKIVVNAQACGRFESTLSYTINGIHTFQLLIEADIQLVSLNISKTSLKMAYLDDVNEIFLKDSVVLKNQGNIPASFAIVQANSKFIIQPESGVIQRGESLTVWVTENNQNYPVIQAGQLYQGRANKITAINDDRILIKITDGNDISLKVTAIPGLSDPKCVVKESKLAFGCTIVSKPKSKTLQLKNLSRSICLFEIMNEQCGQFLTFDCIKGKIPPQGCKQITVTYRSTLIHCLNSNFQILIRGGLIINVPIQGESIAPQVSIIEGKFNFGQICCDTAAVKPINIKNQSQTMVQLFVDLRNRERGVEFLMISLWNSVTTGIGQKSKSSTNSYRSASFEEEIIDNAIKDSGVHRIKIEAKSTLTFNLVFKPTIAGYYEFLLPIFLENFIRNESLTKFITCNAIEPKFIIEPNIIKFKKKIINDKENSCFHPFVEYLTLRNPTDKVLKWKLDVHGQHKTGTSFSTYSSVTLYGTNKRDTISPKLCFQIEQKKGQLKPKESVSINISFNPLEQGFYCHKVPLFIFNQQKGIYHQQAQIRLEGQGKYPSLYFNRRQLIMPVVPIGIESISMFEIYNEGYESINLKHRFQIVDSQGNTHVSKGNLTGDNNFPEIMAVFPEGGKMGINKRQLYVILKFISKKSISFTCKLELYDEATDCRTYSLPISGTADNSILTTFSYLSDPENIYRFQYHMTEVVEGKKNQKVNKGEEVQGNLSVTLKTNDGRNLVDRYHSLYQGLSVDSFNLDCRIIKRWLNNFFREEKIRDFPSDLSQNGQILLKLLHKLTNKKQFDGSWQFEAQGAQGKQTLNGHNNSLIFYEQVLRLMKTMGCLLNHIRPYYLLQRQQFLQYMSKDANWRIYSDYYIKKYQVIYRQAWIVLIYQIIQHFWCARIKNDNSFTSLKVASNVYSPVELQVIRWVKGIYQLYNELEDSKDKFLSFGTDFKDCIAPIFCLVKHSIPPKKLKVLEHLNRKPISINEFASNTKILYQLLQKLNVVPLIYEDEYQLCRQKQIFMFMYQLYELLPQTCPKTPPIIFTCQLGESCYRVIDIRNPSNKTVHYWVKLQGCRDFSFEEKQSIVIQPKSIYPFKVEYKGRLSSQQSAYISFFSKQQAQVNSINGSALVFELRSKITGRKSLKKLQTISCPLYQTSSIKILVENIFEDYDFANFSIQLREQPLQASNTNLSKHKVQISQIYDPQAIQLKQPMQKLVQFYSEIDNLKIKKGSATSFDLYFMPIKLTKTKCFIIFNDPNVGEFQYQIVGIAQIPKPLHQIKYQSNVYVGNKDYIELSLPVYNSYMIKCQSYFDQKYVNAERKTLTKEKHEQKYKFELNMDNKINEYMAFPSEVTLKSHKKEVVNGSQFQNKIKFQYHFIHLLKDLTLDFLLVGDIRREIQDVRRFKVAINIVHKPLQQELVMTTTARKSLTQQIPLENTSNKDWKIKVNILQNQYGWLSLKENDKVFNKEIIVKKGQNQSLLICFQPKWTGRTFGKVNIHNQTTNQQLVFIIRGISQQPLSQNHFHLKVNTLDSTLFTIPITNPYHQRLVYRIYSDIEELQLPPDILLEPSEQIQFNFIADSISTSPLIGFIKFVDEEGRYFWYSVTLECSQKKVREFWVEMISQIGRQIQKVVQFKNPFNKVLSFKVQFPKDCGLQAKDEFTINPHTNYEYKIKFRPIKQMNTEIALKAFNKQIGNIVYHTKLIAKEQTKRKLYTVSAQVGKVGSIDFKLENSYKSNIKVNCHLSNQESFSVQIPELLHPSMQNICKLKFKPSSQGKQGCTLKIWGEHFPTKFFQVQATGIAPYSIESINFKSHVDETCLEILKFNNPNPKKAEESVRVCLSEADNGYFRIVNRPKDQIWQTSVKQVLIIPIQFQPKEKGYFQSVLTVQCYNYQWKYLLKGSTSFKQSQRIHQQITAINKQEIIKLLKIPIPEYILQNMAYFNKIDIEHSDKKVVKCFKNWMKLRLNNPLKVEDSERDEKFITVYLKFRPRKQIKDVIKLVLSNNSEEGPKIYYNMQVNVQSCGTQNIIPLQINSIKGINFDISLASLGLKDAHITKALMGKGVYCQVQKMSQHIRLKFKPNHLIFNRGKTYSDNLMIESEQQQWNFQVQFTLKK